MGQTHQIEARDEVGRDMAYEISHVTVQQHTCPRYSSLGSTPSWFLRRFLLSDLGSWIVVLIVSPVEPDTRGLPKNEVLSCERMKCIWCWY